jgi:hypothetical protein
MLYSYPRQNFGSTSPLFSRYTSWKGSVYPENNREVVPKLYLESKQTMETNPSMHPQAIQKMWTIPNRYGYRYAKVCTPPTVLFRIGDA